MDWRNAWDGTGVSAVSNRDARHRNDYNGCSARNFRPASGRNSEIRTAPKSRSPIAAQKCLTRRLKGRVALRSNISKNHGPCCRCKSEWNRERAVVLISPVRNV